MTSKERVRKTIAHEEPDRVPIGEWGIDHDHVTNIIGRHTYWRNRKDTTLALWDNRRNEVVESMKADYTALVEKLDYDILTVELVPSKNHFVKDRPREIASGVWLDKAGTTYRYAASNDSICCVTKKEGKEEITDSDIEKAMKSIEEMDDSQFELIDYFCDKYGKEKAILCRSIDIYNPLFESFCGGYEHDLMLTVSAPEEIEKLRPVCYAYNQKIIDHCAAKGVDIVMQGQDFGMNSGCIIRPSTIREVFMPVIDEVNKRITKANLIPFYHCCGRVWDIMDDFIRVGYLGYQSVQESAGMDNKILKEKYGEQLTFWTGVQCETLIEGSLSDIKNEVTRNLELMMPKGGFIFGSTNSVQYGAKTENYLYALELVREKGNYLK